MTTIHPCSPAELVTHDIPWGLKVTSNKALRGKFVRACKKAKRKSDRRQAIGSAARRSIKRFPRLKPFLRKPSKLRGWTPKSVDSYNCRQIRGSYAYSRHAYAAAWDFFNKTWDERVKEGVDVWGPTNAPPEWFAKVFEKRGFTWGGRWASRPDHPHIEYSRNTV